MVGIISAQATGVQGGFTALAASSTVEVVVSVVAAADGVAAVMAAGEEAAVMVAVGEADNASGIPAGLSSHDEQARLTFVAPAALASSAKRISNARSGIDRVTLSDIMTMPLA